jgi:hypothetical protein
MILHTLNRELIGAMLRSLNTHVSSHGLFGYEIVK